MTHSTSLRVVKGGVSAPKGFLANGLLCGYQTPGKPDLGIIVSEIGNYRPVILPRVRLKQPRLLQHETY